MTLNDAIVAATAQLKASSSTPALDAQVLLARTLERDRTYVIAHAGDELDAGHQEQFEHLVRRRLEGTPVAYLTGQQEFWSLALRVSEETLIPRPETELLVELALEKIPRDVKTLVADIGTGSGAIALAIASERSKAQIHASDSSANALGVARQNAARLGLSNIDFLEGPVFDPLAGMTYDIIVSNPPYIPEDDLHLTQGDVRFEPRDALAAGPEGLDIIRQIVAGAGQFLRPGGWLMIEHGYDQETAVDELYRRAGFEQVECYRDLAEQPRVTIGLRPH